MKVLFAPDGSPMNSIATFSFECPDLEIDDLDGTAGLGSFNDFPRFEAMSIPGLGNALLGDVGDEWLEQHCRLIEVADEFDIYDDNCKAPVWDDDIVKACHRVHWLGQTLWLLDRFHWWLPPDVREDVVIRAAIDNVVTKRIQNEIDQLQVKIAAYRKDRVEPTELTFDKPACATCADSDGMRLLPCDECGAQDGESDDDG